MKQLRLADGTRLAYELAGPERAPAAVLLDGISCDGYAWRYLKPWLERRFRVLHVHYRGHGRSGVPRDPSAVTLPYLARDLDEVMGRLDLDRAVIAGHSMGVQLALEVAWRHPHRVRAGILLCGSGGRLLDTFQGTDLGMRILPRIREVTERYRDQVAAAFRALVPTELSYWVARYAELNRDLVRREDFMPYLEHFATMPPLLFVRMLQDAAERTSSAFVHRLTQPMLVVAGDRDGFTPWQEGRELASALPDAEWHLLPGGSHTAPIELPQRVEALVAGFIARHALDGPPSEEEPTTLELDLAARWAQAHAPSPGRRRRRAPSPA